MGLLDAGEFSEFQDKTMSQSREYLQLCGHNALRMKARSSIYSGICEEKSIRQARKCALA
jgi:hypothetical protein